MPGYKKPKKFTKKADSSKPTQPLEPIMLTYGVNNNYHKWAEAMRAEIAINYSSFVSVFDDDELYLPEEVDTSGYNPAHDPHGFIKCQLQTQIAEREKTVRRNELREPMVAALMWKYLSPESREAVMRHEDYHHDDHRTQPLQMHRSIRETHQVGGAAADAASRRAQSRLNYHSTKQGPMESIIDYKTRFTYNKESYDVNGNVDIPPGDVAIDFMNGLDNGRYARFVADLQNDRAKGHPVPATLNEMFQRASTFVVVKSNPRPGGGAVFTTTADEAHTFNNRRGGKGGRGGRGRGGRGQSGRGGGRGHIQRDTKSGGDEKRPRRTIVCYNCDEEGHISSHCPHRVEEVGEHDTAFVTVGHGSHQCKESPDGHCYVTTRKFKKTDALLDWCFDVTVVWKGLLTNLRKERSYVGGFGGAEGVNLSLIHI